MPARRFAALKSTSRCGLLDDVRELLHTVRHLAEEAERILALCVAEPSELPQRSHNAAALVAALPPCHALFASLLPQRLGLQGAQALACLIPQI